MVTRIKVVERNGGGLQAVLCGCFIEGVVKRLKREGDFDYWFEVKREE